MSCNQSYEDSQKGVITLNGERYYPAEFVESNMELPPYTEIMKEIYGDEWAVNGSVCSASADRASHNMYNYIAQLKEE